LRPVRAAVARAVVFLYALFLLMPHFGSLTHVHTGGGAAHHHTAASLHDVTLERQLLTMVGGGAPRLESPVASARGRSNSSAAPEGGAHGSVTSAPTDEARATTISDRDARAHTHASYEPGVVALGTPTLAAATAATHAPAADAVPGFIPALAILASPARAPPAHT